MIFFEVADYKFHISYSYFLPNVLRYFFLRKPNDLFGPHRNVIPKNSPQRQLHHIFVQRDK